MRRWVADPARDVGTMANSEVAVACSAAMPNPRRNTGSITMPPPIPSMPESTPTPKPTQMDNRKSAMGPAYSETLRRTSFVKPASMLAVIICSAGGSMTPSSEQRTTDLRRALRRMLSPSVLTMISGHTYWNSK